MTQALGGARLRAAGALALVGLVAACGTGGSDNGGGGSNGPKTGPGVDAASKTITLGVITPLSGPAAVIGKYLTRGQETYFNALNAGGGINGWKVKLIERDDQYNPQLHVQFYNEIVNQIAFLAQSLGSPTTKAIQPQVDSAKIVVGAAAQDSAFVTDPVMAVIGTPYAVDVANGLHYIVKTQGKSDAKIGIIYQNDEYGADGIRGYEAGLSQYHFNDVGRASYNVTDTDFSAQVLKMKSAGAQYVFVTAIPTAAGKIVGTAAALGFFPQWVFQGPAWSEFLMTSNGTPSGTPTPIEQALAKGTWVLGYEAAWGDTSVAGMSKFIADQQKYAADQPPDGYFMYGYCEAMMEADILRKALQDGDLSRAGILNAKLNLGHVSFGGLIPDADYSPSLGPASRISDVATVDVSSPGFLKIQQTFFEGDAAKSLKFGSS